MDRVSKKLKSLNSKIKDTEVVEKSEEVVKFERDDKIDELHMTVKHKNLEEVKSYINEYDWEIAVLNTKELNSDKTKIEEYDLHKLKVGYAGRI